MDEAGRKAALGGLIQLALIYFGGWWIMSMIDKRVK